MSKMWVLFIPVFITGAVSGSQTRNWSTLSLVSVITRHGSRSPLVTYKYDEHPSFDERYWPDGVGQLTLYGKRQMYTTGMNLRERYSGYLSPYYRKMELSATSNPMDRDFMSAQCLLTGLYPPIGYQVWNRYIDWQPVPVYEEPFDVSKVIDSSYFCPRARFLADLADKEFDEQPAPWLQPVYDVLSNFSGEKVSNARQGQDFYEIFQLSLENGFSLLSWAYSIFPEPLTTLAVLRTQARVGRTRDLLRLTAGPLLNKILNQFLTKIEGKISKKMYVQAGHDNTLLALMAALGVTDMSYPGTSSYVVFELHKISSEFFVKVMFFKSCLETTPMTLNVPNCPTPCSLNDFARLVNDLAPRDWFEECNR